MVNAERREIHFSGRVQGVGFRYTARNISVRHQVTGFVQNLPDGRVWMIVEGQSAEIDQFLNEVRGELRRFIQGEQSASHRATGEFADFSIRH